MPVESKVSICGRKLDRPEHLCAFFDSREEHYDAVVPFYLEGLQRGEQVITVVDAAEHDAHCFHLSARGVAVDEAIAEQSLRVLTSEQTYLNGEFSAERMIGLLRDTLTDARRHGRRVRASGIMDWTSRDHPGTEELAAYEAQINLLPPQFGCTLVCIYDVSRLTRRQKLDVLATHPLVLEGGLVRENPRYRPPRELTRQRLLIGRDIRRGSKRPSTDAPAS